MRLLVCGGRDYLDEVAAFRALDAAHKVRPVTLVIEGGAKGADTLARRWAALRGIHCATVPALWDAYGRRAGRLRNTAMLCLAPEGVVALPGGRGTADMVAQAVAAGVVVWQPYVVTPDS